jgi:hypothetical protein
VILGYLSDCSTSIFLLSESVFGSVVPGGLFSNRFRFSSRSWLIAWTRVNNFSESCSTAACSHSSCQRSLFRMRHFYGYKKFCVNTSNTLVSLGRLYTRMPKDCAVRICRYARLDSNYSRLFGSKFENRRNQFLREIHLVEEFRSPNTLNHCSRFIIICKRYRYQFSARRQMQ